MTTERKGTAGGRWADTKDMERQASNSNMTGANGEVDESTMPLNPKKPDNKSSVNKGKAGRTKNGYLCQVQLLDGNEFEVEVPTSAIGQVLFDKVCDHISLAERDYFSLSYRDRADIKFWLNHGKKISKQIGSGAYVFMFEVKFYPTEPETMREDFTRYLLFLQLRTDILSGRLPCSFVTHALLASYAIQSDVGDYETDSHGHGSGFEYLLNTEFAPNQGEELMEKVAELHRTHRGLTPEEAELEYLNNAKKLAMYGIELHPAKDKEGDVIIGVCASGLLVYRGKLRIHRFSWPKILKIAYKRNKFTIYVRPGEFEQGPSKLVYELANYTMAKKLWKIAVEHHGFFRLKEPETQLRAMFPLFGSKFRYSGRTQYQSRSDPKPGNRPTARVDRSASRRFAPTRPIDTSGPTFSTERKEEVISGSDQPITTLDLRNRPKRNVVPYASLEEDPNLTGMDEGQVSLMRSPGNYSQVGWSKPKGTQGYGGPTYQGTPWDQQGFQLCDSTGRPLRDGHSGPIYIKYGTPIVQSEKQLSDMYGNPIPHNYDGKVYDREGNPIAESPTQLYDRYGNPISWPGHRGPVFGIYGKPQTQDIYDGEHKPVKPTHIGPVYDRYGNPCVPVEIVYGKNMRPAGYDKPGYQLCDEYGYPLQPSHEGQILIKYGVPIARGTYELCDINGVPITRDYDGPVYDRWGNLLAPGIENLYDEYGNPIYLATHDGPVYGRYGIPIAVDLYDKDGRPIRPGHRGQVYDLHRQVLVPLEVLDDGAYSDSTARRRGPPTLEKPPSRVSGTNVRDSKGNMILSSSPYPLAEGDEGLPPYADRDRSPYSVTTTTRTTTRTYRGADGTMVTEHKTEKDGVIETRIEKKTTIVTQVDDTNEIDFDKLLSAAIMGATELNPDMSVEKIEIHTETQ